MSNISTCEAVELVRNAIDPYSMMGISADDMVYASVKRHMLRLLEKVNACIGFLLQSLPTRSQRLPASRVSG